MFPLVRPIPFPKVLHVLQACMILPIQIALFHFWYLLHKYLHFCLMGYFFCLLEFWLLLKEYICKVHRPSIYLQLYASPLFLLHCQYNFTLPLRGGLNHHLEYKLLWVEFSSCYFLKLVNKILQVVRRMLLGPSQEFLYQVHLTLSFNQRGSQWNKIRLPLGYCYLQPWQVVHLHQECEN